MKEKLAQWLYSDSMYGNLITWDDLANCVKDNFRVRADRLIILLKKKIKKSLLTELGILGAADKACDKAKKEGICKTGDSCMDCRLREKAVAQAQLDKVLKILT